MRTVNQTALGSIRAPKSFQQPFPGAAPVGLNYHRRLIELAAIVIILGGLFLLFWQGVLQSPPTTVFVEDYCTGMLGRYVTADVAANANFDIGQDGQLASCSVSGDATSGLAVSWGGSYDCNGTAVRYKSEENPNWLALAIESEIPELLYSNETLIANLSGLPRFSYAVTVYNPAARQSFEAELEMLSSHSCAI